MKNVFFMNARSGALSNADEREASIKKTTIVLKYVFRFLFCFKKKSSLNVRNIYARKLRIRKT